MRRVLSHDPESGLSQIAHIDDDGCVTVETAQDAEPGLARNREEARDPERQKGDARWRVASIPAVIVVKWLNEHGVNVFDPEHGDAVERLLNDRDWRWLRTMECRI